MIPQSRAKMGLIVFLVTFPMFLAADAGGQYWKKAYVDIESAGIRAGLGAVLAGLLFFFNKVFFK
jgi:hypothetical protein